VRYFHPVFLLSMTLLLVSSCEEREVESFQTIQFNIDKAQRIKLSELADTIRFIRLITPDDLQLSSISMVKSTKDYFVVKNSANPPSLFVFNRDGEFESKIESFGKGPGEYISISSFLIDPEKGHIELIDRMSQKKLIFTMQNEFIEENRGSKWGGEDIFKQNDRYIVHYGNVKSVSDYSIGIYDSDYKKKASYIKIPDNYVNFFHITDDYNLSSYNGETLFWRALSPDIYSISQDKLYKKYEIDFGKNNIPSKVFNEHYDNVGVFMRKIWDMDYASIIGSAGEGDRFLFLRASKGKDLFYHLFYDKENDIAKVVNCYQDDILFDQDWELDISDITVVSYEDNKLYFSVDAYQMNHIINHKDGDTQQKINSTEYLSKAVGDISIYGNPFLIELSLKK